MYGEHLFERRNFSQAALGERITRIYRASVLTFLHPPVFVQAEKPVKATIAYEKALDWRELFDLAVRENTPEDKLIGMGLRVAGETKCMFSVSFGVDPDLDRRPGFEEAVR